MNETIGTTDAWLRDIELLKQHKARYGDCADRCATQGMPAADELAQLFTEDAVLDFRELFGQVLTGRSEIRHHFGVNIYADRAWMWHSFSNPIIEISGDRARARWLLYAMTAPASDPDAPPSVVYGRYDDEYVRSGSGWLQTRLKILHETRGAR